MLGGLAVAAVALIGGGGGGGEEVTQPARPQPVAHVPPRSLLARSPYMGLSCPRPNSIACDRIGLAVYLREPARSVRATIGTRSWRLDDTDWSGYPSRGLRRAFAGFLQPAGLREPGPLKVEVENGRNRFTGRTPVIAPVRLVVTRADGSKVATRLRLLLSAGWG